MVPKAIDTQYKGCRFRSRLEARWAVFFDALGIEWEYEKEGYELPTYGGNTFHYLPDFWLPNERLWFEVKGQDASAEETEKCRSLRDHVGAVILAEGNIGEQKLTLFCYDLSDSSGGSSEWGCHFIGETYATITRLVINNANPNKTLYRFDIGDGEIPFSGWEYRKPLKDAYKAARSARFEHGERK